MEIHLIRHTAPDIEKNVCYGQSDILLKDTFQEEAKFVLEQLPPNADIIYTSPLIRCATLAEKIAATLNLPVKKDDRLKEMNFGSWEMQRWKDIDQGALTKWMNDYQNERCPQGESYLDLINRLQNFFDAIRMEEHQSVIVVTHAGVIKSSHAILNGVSLKEAIAVKANYGSVMTFHSNRKNDATGTKDHYFENGLMVFTEAYHLRRGYCCQNGCRHCPYGFKKKL